MIRIVWHVLVFGTVCLLFSENLLSDESGDPQGYTDVVQFRDDFIAVGTDGRIDSISRSGSIVPVDRSNSNRLNCAFSNHDLVVVAGDQGTILYSFDGKQFAHAESGSDKPIYEITSQNGLIFAGTEKGIVLVSEDGNLWGQITTHARGDIISLSANPFFMIGITTEGEIIKSFDAINWEISDYNQAYAGYNPLSTFKKILATENSILIIGTHDNGSPSLLSSSLGNVWAERVPVYHDHEDMIVYLEETPNDLVYDSDQDQFILACDKGVLFALPTCTKCNKYFKTSETDLNALICVKNYLMVVGDQYAVFSETLTF